MSDIFLSYAREDRARAEWIATELAHRGWSVWWDQKLRVGKSFSRVIEQELDLAKCVIVLWSRVSIDSPWVLNEAAEGAARQILIPVRIEDVRIPLQFRHLHAADFLRDPTDDQFRDFTSAIEDLVSRSGKPRESHDPRPTSVTGIAELRHSETVMGAGAEVDQPRSPLSESAVTQSRATTVRLTPRAIGVGIILILILISTWPFVKQRIISWILPSRPEPEIVSRASNLPIKLAAKAQLGAVMLPYTVTMLGGTSFDLAQYRGKVVFLDLWATWSGTFRSELNELKELERRFASPYFQIVCVNIETADPDEVRKFVEDNRIPYAVALDPTAKLADILHTTVVPTSALIDPAGKLVWVHHGVISIYDAELTDAIRRCLRDK